MVWKHAIISGALGLASITPAHAQMSSTFNPNFVFQQTLPVIASPCKGGNCKNGATTRPRSATGDNRANAQATCANARKMTPREDQRAKLVELLTLCDRAGY